MMVLDKFDKKLVHKSAIPKRIKNGKSSRYVNQNVVENIKNRCDCNCFSIISIKNPYKNDIKNKNIKSLVPKVDKERNDESCGTKMESFGILNQREYYKYYKESNGSIEYLESKGNDSSAISINLENPNYISVSIGKSNKVSITETESKTNINIDTRSVDTVSSATDVLLKLPEAEAKLVTNPCGITEFTNYIYDTSHLEGIDLSDTNLSKGDFLYNQSGVDISVFYQNTNQTFMNHQSRKPSNEFLISSNFLLTDIEESSSKSNNKLSSTERLYTNNNFHSKSQSKINEETFESNKENKNSFQIFERNPFSYIKDYYRDKSDCKLLYHSKKSKSDTGITSNACIEISDNVDKSSDSKTETDVKICTVFTSLISSDNYSSRNAKSKDNMAKKRSTFMDKLKHKVLRDKSSEASFLSTMDCTPDYYRHLFGPTLDETILSGMDVVCKKIGGKTPSISSKNKSKYSSQKSKKKFECDSDIFTSTSNNPSIQTNLSRIVSSTGVDKEPPFICEKIVNTRTCTKETCPAFNKPKPTKKPPPTPTTPPILTSTDEMTNKSDGIGCSIQLVSKKKSLETKKSQSTPPPCFQIMPLPQKSVQSKTSSHTKLLNELLCPPSCPGSTSTAETARKSTCAGSRKKICPATISIPGIDPTNLVPCNALKKRDGSQSNCQNIDLLRSDGSGTSPSVKKRDVYREPQVTIEENVRKAKFSTSVIDVPAKFQTKGCEPRETRFAITRILKFDDFTTYEIYKSTRAKPKCMPQLQEGIFVLKNRTIL